MLSISNMLYHYYGHNAAASLVVLLEDKKRLTFPTRESHISFCLQPLKKHTQATADLSNVKLHCTF